MSRSSKKPRAVRQAGSADAPKRRPARSSTKATPSTKATAEKGRKRPARSEPKERTPSPPAAPPAAPPTPAAAPEPLRATPAPLAPTARFADGAAAHQAATATTRLDQSLPVLEPQPDAGPGLDALAGEAQPHGRGVLAELRHREPRLTRRLRGEVIQPLLAATARLTDPRTYRRWISARLMQRRSDVVDDFGLDPVYAERLRPLFELLYRRYWRVETRGMANIPDHGRAIVVANHSGTVPYDAAMLMYAVRYDHPAHRTARPLIEDVTFHFPFLGVAMNRIGAVRASPDNAERLLADGQLVIVFPEGIKGMGKLYRQRYRLQRFGRGGFVKLALQTGAPIIPAAVIGAEEIHPLLTRVTWLTKSLGLPYVPITPTFPWLGPLGAVPLPSKWRLVFGDPIDPGRAHGREAATDRVLVNRISEQVRAAIQAMIDECLASRTSSFFDS